MRFRKNKATILNTERLRLRLPQLSDHSAWAELRRESREFIEPWEPAWAEDHLSKDAFQTRVERAEVFSEQQTALPLLMIRRDDERIVGGITLDQIHFGPAQVASLGYWIGLPFARQGFMKEAILKLVHHSFVEMGLSRVEAACVPENQPSRRLLENTGFKYEGVAQSYLEVNGKWRNHVLYANLRRDRRDRAATGQLAWD